ncbi:hypothetical protein JIN85_13575 [Luteolibacter pohnpeiensis]|uniref:Uncharacterized protein n=1 Tax=Luteolibacter pohnpeiensis TaxID=454153 RepID=A0A934S6D1_9BACT|nr:hypothetical protein [Luteolibacter pohnpeiensis]MBK1883451.1 hypothetical protein [Luteolibacter pohnpeiensis]
MSEEEITPEDTGSKPAAKVRRISNPRARKKAKKAVEVESDTAEKESAPVEMVAEPKQASAEIVAQEPAPKSEPTSSDSDVSENDVIPTISEEPIATISSGQPSHDSKKKRRRRKGKGANAHHEESQAAGETVAEGSVGQAPQNRNNPNPRPQLDPDVVAVKAWKIFLAEVSEEGVALINDQDARDLARRCFRLSEIFLEERARRRRD